jgi:hypothetical protein
MTRRLPWARRRRGMLSPSGAPPSMPSLDLLLQTAIQERDKQIAHFDALDTKAGVLLAFDGVLIALSHGIRLAFQLPGIALAAASAVAALAAFWPRKYPVVEPMSLRQFLTYDLERTRLKLHDTIARTVMLGGEVLRVKIRNLKLALTLLVLAALTFGAGILFTTISHNTERGHHGIQKSTSRPAPKSTGTRASASPSTP